MTSTYKIEFLFKNISADKNRMLKAFTLLLSTLAFATATIKDCDSSSQFKLTDLALYPDPPKRGEQVYMTVIFNNPGPEITDGKVTTSVTLNGIPFTPSTKPLCEDTECPLTVGINNRSTMSVWPSTVSGKINSKIQWHDTNGKSLLCIQTSVSVSSYEPVPLNKSLVPVYRDVFEDKHHHDNPPAPAPHHDNPPAPKPQPPPPAPPHHDNPPAPKPQPPAPKPKHSDKPAPKPEPPAPKPPAPAPHHSDKPAPKPEPHHSDKPAPKPPAPAPHHSDKPAPKPEPHHSDKPAPNPHHTDKPKPHHTNKPSKKPSHIPSSTTGTGSGTTGSNPTGSGTTGSGTTGSGTTGSGTTGSNPTGSATTGSGTTGSGTTGSGTTGSGTTGSIPSGTTININIKNIIKGFLRGMTQSDDSSGTTTSSSTTGSSSSNAEPSPSTFMLRKHRNTHRNKV